MGMITIVCFSLFFCIVASFFALHAKNQLSAVIYSGVFSVFITIAYIALQAPDVAITEAAVGSAISTIFFLIYLTSKHSAKEDNNIITFSHKWIVFILLALFFIATTYSIICAIDSSKISSGISAYYLEKMPSDYGIINYVTAILGGYRGLDTLFETSVIFTAAAGVLSILNNNGKDQ